jgi:hypothetical protein
MNNNREVLMLKLTRKCLFTVTAVTLTTVSMANLALAEKITGAAAFTTNGAGQVTSAAIAVGVGSQDAKSTVLHSETGNAAIAIGSGNPITTVFPASENTCPENGIVETTAASANSVNINAINGTLNSN